MSRSSFSGQEQCSELHSIDLMTIRNPCLPECSWWMDGWCFLMDGSCARSKMKLGQSEHMCTQRWNCLCLLLGGYPLHKRLPAAGAFSTCQHFLQVLFIFCGRTCYFILFCSLFCIFCLFFVFFCLNFASSAAFSWDKYTNNRWNLPVAPPRAGNPTDDQFQKSSQQVR